MLTLTLIVIPASSGQRLLRGSFLLENALVNPTCSCATVMEVFKNFVLANETQD